MTLFETLDTNPKYIMLVKVQMLRELNTRFVEIRRTVDKDFACYLQDMANRALLGCNTAKELDIFLGDSMRMGLQEWIDSLTTEHITRGGKL